MTSAKRYRPNVDFQGHVKFVANRVEFYLRLMRDTNPLDFDEIGGLCRDIRHVVSYLKNSEDLSGGYVLEIGSKIVELANNIEAWSNSASNRNKNVYLMADAAEQISVCVVALRDYLSGNIS